MHWNGSLDRAVGRRVLRLSELVSGIVSVRGVGGRGWAGSDLCRAQRRLLLVARRTQ